MDDLKLKTLASRALKEVSARCKASPTGIALRADIARALGLSFQDALRILEYLRNRGDIALGDTINDTYARLNI